MRNSVTKTYALTVKKPKLLVCGRMLDQRNRARSSGASRVCPKVRQAQAHHIDYNWEVRPILSDNCYRCHGPDAKARQAGLRLDQKDSAYAQAIDPGKPNESELMKRIASKDTAYRMPPPAASAKSLTDAEVATLREWIQEGAEFKPHWAFVAPVK